MTGQCFFVFIFVGYDVVEEFISVLRVRFVAEKSYIPREFGALQKTTRLSSLPCKASVIYLKSASASKPSAK